jgi:hypothetical protein
MDETQRDLGRLEGRVEAQGESITALTSRVDANHDAVLSTVAANHRAVTDKLNELLAYQERQKGGAKVFFAMSSAAASGFGALAALAVDWLKK